MIEIESLKESDVGRWVEYCPAFGKRQKGRIKSWNNKFVFVVYHCDDNWNDYQNYTAAATLPDALSFQQKGNQKMNDTQAKIIELLRSTHRDGIESLIDYLKDEGFFEAPASTRFHGSYAGGLAFHSLRVCELVCEFVAKFSPSKKVGYGQMPIKIKLENIIIACLLHDICKIGAYVRTKADDGWANNRDKEKGHAKLTIARIKKFIELEKLEEMMIKFHMGIYGLKEFQDKKDDPNGEYPLRGDHSKDPKDMTKGQKAASQKSRYGKSLANAYYHNPVCKLMSIADELATFEEKAEMLKGENHEHAKL